MTRVVVRCVERDDGPNLKDAWLRALSQDPRSFSGGFLAPDRDVEARVFGVRVDPMARGVGVGRELVTGVVAWARVTGGSDSHSA